MRVLCCILLALALALTLAHAQEQGHGQVRVKVAGWSVAGRHASAWYQHVSKLRAQGYTNFVLPPTTLFPTWVDGFLVASKTPIDKAEWRGASHLTYSANGRVHTLQ
jgi:hypothetical protein